MAAIKLNKYLSSRSYLRTLSLSSARRGRGHNGAEHNKYFEIRQVHRLSTYHCRGVAVCVWNHRSCTWLFLDRLWLLWYLVWSLGRLIFAFKTLIFFGVNSITQAKVFPLTTDWKCMHNDGSVHCSLNLAFWPAADALIKTFDSFSRTLKWFHTLLLISWQELVRYRLSYWYCVIKRLLLPRVHSQLFRLFISYSHDQADDTYFKRYTAVCFGARIPSTNERKEALL